MTTSQLTASRLELASKCPGAFALPHTERESAPAATGTLVHSYIEGLLTGVDPALPSEPVARRICSGLDPEKLLVVATSGHPDSPIQLEQAVALGPNADHAVLLPKTARHRDYSAAPEGYIPGTADVVAAVVNEETVAVTDWKTGSTMPTDPERNPQLRFHALAQALVHKATAVDVQIGYINHSGEIHASSFRFEAKDLARMAAGFRHLIERVNEARNAGDPTLVVGGHCVYCPAFFHCPAQAGAAQALVDFKEEELTDKNIGEAWRRLQAVEAATKKVRTALAGYLEIRESPISLGGRAQLKLIEASRESILPDLAMPILRDNFGDDADEAVSLTKKGIERLAESHAQGRAKEVLATLRDAGATKTTYSKSLREGLDEISREDARNSPRAEGQ